MIYLGCQAFLAEAAQNLLTGLAVDAGIDKQAIAAPDDNAGIDGALDEAGMLFQPGER